MSWPKTFGPDGSSHDARAELLQRHGPTLKLILQNPYHVVTPEVPKQPFWETEATIDSGASCICISRKHVRHLGLIRAGPTNMIAVGAEHPASMYIGRVVVPELEFARVLPVCAPDGVHVPQPLLGRSFLRFFVMSYHGPLGMFQFEGPATAPSPEIPFDE